MAETNGVSHYWVMIRYLMHTLSCNNNNNNNNNNFVCLSVKVSLSSCNY